MKNKDSFQKVSALRFFGEDTSSGNGKLRIGIDFVPMLSEGWSGVEQYFFYTLKALLEEDKKNTYVIFYVDYKNYKERFEKFLQKNPWFKRVPNLEVVSLPWRGSILSLQFSWKVFRKPQIDKICGGLDVMWLPAPRFIPLSRACRRVTTFHDLSFFIYPQFYSLKSRLWQWQANYPQVARNSDRIIAVSENTRKDLVNFFKVDPHKIRVIYEGVAPQYFVKFSPNFLRKLEEKFKLPQKFIYFVGSLEPRKNLSLLLNVLNELKSKLSDKIYLVVSSSKRWLTDSFFTDLNRLRLEERVVLTGPVNEEEKIGLLQLSSVFAFPSFYEGFGLPVLEAMACGVPVVASNVSSLPEVAGEAALQVSPHDKEAWVQALRSILSDRALAAHLQEEGIKRARLFSWQKTARETLKVFRETALLER